MRGENSEKINELILEIYKNIILRWENVQWKCIVQRYKQVFEFRRLRFATDLLA